jgi:putative toxin-antitoxin system antitoxin component (TIGR02293 family)
MAKEKSRQRARGYRITLKETPRRRAQAVMETVLGVGTGSSRDAIRAINEGIEGAAVGRLAGYFEVAESQMLDVIDVPRSTFSRRKKEGGRLTSGESDRLYRVTRLLARAAEVFGDEAEARNWMRTSKRALGDVSPLIMARTDAGAQEVEDLLGRIERGIPS